MNEGMNGFTNGPINGNIGSIGNEGVNQYYGQGMNGVSVPVINVKQQRVQKQYTMEKLRMKEEHKFFIPGTLLYAVFYTFCMFRNDAGITFLFFVIASLAYMHMAMKRLNIIQKKGNIFYTAAMLLLAVSTFCTDDARIIIFNKAGIFLLAMSMLLRQFYDTSKWELGKYMGSIIETALGAIGELPEPFLDITDFVKKEGKQKKELWYGLMGTVIAIPLLMLVTVLLSSADVFFGQMTSHLLKAFDMETVAGITIRIVAVFFIVYMLISYLCCHSLKEEVKDNRTGEPVLAITISSLLTAVYLLFSFIQIFGLFLGKLKLPAGYTYAQYAREGFFQLLAVSILNLILVLAFLSLFRESKELKGVLVVMSLCTFIMIASSAMRMILYIKSYDLTFLRILVLWTLALLTVLFTGVLAKILKNDFKLFRYSMVAVTVMYLALSFSHPDYIIASYNIQKADADRSYLCKLSTDAAPALVPFLKEDKSGDRYIVKIKTKGKAMDPRTFNVSRYIAYRAVE